MSSAGAEEKLAGSIELRQCPSEAIEAEFEIGVVYREGNAQTSPVAEG
jgi:hypothetical protein